MKNFYVAAICVFTSSLLLAQNNIGIGTTSPHPSAVLDLMASDKGMLIPRTTIGSLAAPFASGLVIFDTDSNCFVMYDGTVWKNLCTSGGGGVTDILFNPDGSVTVESPDGQFTTIDKAWLTKGNSGTNAANDFVGTVDAQDLVLRSNNTEVFRITTTGAVGINTQTPAPSALMEMTSTTRGVLFPSLSTTQRNAIATPAVGLVVYNNTENVHQFWNGTCWVNVGQTVCSFDYSLSQSDSTGCLLNSNFNSVENTLTITLVDGTPSPVVLTAAGVPAGVLVNFSNNYLLPTQTSVMTFTALPSAVPGTYTITILATSGSNVKTLTYELTVYDFGLSLGTTAGNVNEINFQSNVNTVSSAITIGNPGACGSTGTNALLSATNLPVGVTITFDNTSINVPGTTNMTITASSCAEPGIYQISVNATIGSSSQSVIYTLTVLPSVVDITTSVNNLNLHSLVGSPSCGISATFNIAAGVEIGSTTTANAALQTGTFGSGSDIVINNNGLIAGRGGNGGEHRGNALSADCSEMNGKAGGPALELNIQGVTINNNGTIGGGGGGGGGGAGRTNNCAESRSGGGGGGGAGVLPGTGGAGGTNSVCNAGTNGTSTTGGTGGAGCARNCFLGNITSGNGGNGGALGQPGTAGTGGSGGLIGGSVMCGTAGSGGAAGCGIRTNGNAYTLTGTALVGPVCP